MGAKSLKEMTLHELFDAAETELSVAKETHIQGLTESAAIHTARAQVFATLALTVATERQTNRLDGCLKPLARM